MARQIEQTGKTISEAVETAVKKLGVELSDVEYKVLSEGSRGFLGLGAKPAKVLVTVTGEDEAEEILEEVKIEEVAEEVKEPRKFFKKETTVVEKATEEVTEVVVEETVETEKVEAPVENSRANLTEEDKKIILGTATDFLKSIFDTMGMEVKINTSFEDNKQILINLEGEEMGAIIGKRGQTLDSLQYLANRVANKHQSGYVRVKLDTENYRARREETLKHLAKNIAHKVKRNRRPVILEPMNPYERRIIHSTLQSDPYVTTHSEGEEPYRRVVVTLVRNRNNR